MANYDITLHWILDLEPYESSEATDAALFDALGEHTAQNGLNSMTFSISGFDTLLATANQKLSSHQATEVLSGDYWNQNGKIVWYNTITIEKNGAAVVLSQQPRGELALIAEITRA